MRSRAVVHGKSEPPVGYDNMVSYLEVVVTRTSGMKGLPTLRDLRMKAGSNIGFRCFLFLEIKDECKDVCQRIHRNTG